MFGDIFIYFLPDQAQIVDVVENVGFSKLATRKFIPGELRFI